MWPVQRGLPLLSSIPAKWPLIPVDIKDCFFSIPLCVKDSKRFAITVPSLNHEKPDKRYQWVVLLQGMVNSPTMCQPSVGEALLPIRKKYPEVRCIHYMDDILIAARLEEVLHKVYTDLVQALEERGLFIAPEKAQQKQVIDYLGASLQDQ